MAGGRERRSRSGRGGASGRVPQRGSRVEAAPSPADEPGLRRALTGVGGPVAVRGFGPAGDDALQAGLVAVLARGDDAGAVDRLTHGFHSYPARMHPGVAAEALARFAPQGARVLDPCCGSGTVLVEAMVGGHRATGVDLSPLATRLSALRCALRDARERARFLAALEHVTAASLERVRARVPARAPLSPRERAFYAPHVLIELAGLREEIRAVEPADDRRALLLVLSSLLVKLSLQRGDTSEEAAPKRLRKGLASELFQRKGHELAQRWAALYEAAGPRAVPPRIVEGDARALPELLGRASEASPAEGWDPDGFAGRVGRARALPGHPPRFDLVLCSPPYGGTYDYVAHHARRYAWLGLDPSALERGELGARRRYTGPGASVRRFDDELRALLASIAAVCARDANVLLLVGDAEVAGRRLDAAEQLARLGRAAGLEAIAAASQARRDFVGGAPRREHLVLLRPARRR